MQEIRRAVAFRGGEDDIQPDVERLPGVALQNRIAVQAVQLRVLVGGATEAHRQTEAADGGAPGARGDGGGRRGHPGDARLRHGEGGAAHGHGGRGRGVRGTRGGAGTGVRAAVAEGSGAGAAGGAAVTAVRQVGQRGPDKQQQGHQQGGETAGGARAAVSHDAHRQSP